MLFARRILHWAKQYGLHKFTVRLQLGGQHANTLLWWAYKANKSASQRLGCWRLINCKSNSIFTLFVCLIQNQIYNDAVIVMYLVNYYANFIVNAYKVYLIDSKKNVRKIWMIHYKGTDFLFSGLYNTYFAQLRVSSLLPTSY